MGEDFGPARDFQRDISCLSAEVALGGMMREGGRWRVFAVDTYAPSGLTALYGLGEGLPEGEECFFGPGFVFAFTAAAAACITISWFWSLRLCLCGEIGHQGDVKVPIPPLEDGDIARHEDGSERGG